MKKITSVLLALWMLVSALPLGAFAEGNALPEQASLPESEEALNLGEKLPSAKEVFDVLENKPEGVTLPAPSSSFEEETPALEELPAEALMDTVLETEIPTPPVSDVKAEATSGTTGECTWRLDGTHLTISGNGKMADYEASIETKAPWGMRITSVKIENGVTNIGAYAFAGCKDLTEVTIGNSVVTIESSALRFCRSLTSVSLPDSVTTIRSCAFYACEKLETINGGNGVCHVEAEVLSGTKFLNSNYNAGLLYLGKTAYAWTGMSPDVLTIKDGTLGIAVQAFHNCYTTTSVVIPDTVIVIGDFAFQNCMKLTEVMIPNSVTTIGRSAFHNCGELKSFTMSNSVTFVGESAFSLCYKLTSIKLSESLTELSAQLFANCTSLTSITIPNSVKTIGSSSFYGCRSLRSVDIPESVMTIGSSAFEECERLQTIELPDSIKTIQSEAFKKCHNLKGILIPNSVTSLNSYAFVDCESLSWVVLGESLTTISGMLFSGCQNLRSVIIPKGVTTLGSYAFEDCVSLQYLSLPKSLTAVEYSTFANCISLEYVWYEGSVEDLMKVEINLLNDALYNALFYVDACSSNVHQYEEYGYFCTRCACPSCEVSCFGGEEHSFWILFVGGYFVIGGEGPMLYESHPFFAMAAWGNDVVEVYIEEGVTSIAEAAFSGCSDLVSVWIPKTVGKIGAGAFNGCNKLQTVYYEGSRRDWSKISVEGQNEALQTAHVYYHGCDENHRLASDCDTVCNRCYEVVNAAAAHTFEGENPICTLCGGHRDLKYTVDESGFATITDCDASVSTLVLPEKLDGVPVKVIGEGAFAGCASLEALGLPSSVTKVEKDAFSGCTALTSLCYEGNAEEFAKISVESGNDALMGAEFHEDACLGNPETWEHVFDNACDKACNACGERRVPEPHVFDDENDEACNVCGAPPYVLGDLDGVEGVTAADAIYLLYHTLLGDVRYPIDQPADFDGNGIKDAADAIYLLYHTLLGGERYPLHG